MPRRTSLPIRSALISVYREQLAAGSGPNHTDAGRRAGCTRQCAARHFSSPLPGTASSAPQPSIADLLAAEQAEVDAARAATTQAVGAAAAAQQDLQAPPRPAPLVARPPEDPAIAEARVVRTARNAAEGAVALAVALLSGLTPLVRATKKRLELLATVPDEADPLFAVRLHSEITKSLAVAAGAIERITSVQSTLSARPNVTTAVRVERAGERLDDAEIRRRADLVLARLKARGLDLGAEDGPDPIPLPSPTAAEHTGEPLEAEIVPADESEPTS